ncbi:MAG: MATE family efflux transporter, partial [Firmicutes bacterium]|nr:MATE family efflux transporter [Bacillota bacterium]
MTRKIRNTAWDMTVGSPAALLLRFGVPLLIGNVFQQLYSLVDSIVIGQFVGSNELGGIGCTGSIDYLVFSISYGMSS